MVNGFLLGVVATSSLAVAAFFLKFWRRTHDTLFLYFGIAFLVEGLNRVMVLPGAPKRRQPMALPRPAACVSNDSRRYSPQELRTRPVTSG